MASVSIRPLRLGECCAARAEAVEVEVNANKHRDFMECLPQRRDDDVLRRLLHVSVFAAPLTTSCNPPRLKSFGASTCPGQSKPPLP